jgi:hypothetical protein
MLITCNIKALFFLDRKILLTIIFVNILFSLIFTGIWLILMDFSLIQLFPCNLMLAFQIKLRNILSVKIQLFIFLSFVHEHDLLLIIFIHFIDWQYIAYLIQTSFLQISSFIRLKHILIIQSFHFIYIALPLIPILVNYIRILMILLISLNRDLVLINILYVYHLLIKQLIFSRIINTTWSCPIPLSFILITLQILKYLLNWVSIY